jgi:hypothetical protein
MPDAFPVGIASADRRRQTMPEMMWVNAHVSDISTSRPECHFLLRSGHEWLNNQRIQNLITDEDNENHLLRCLP